MIMPIEPSTLYSALNDMRKGIAHIPDDWYRVRSVIQDNVYRDILAHTNGNRENTIRLYINFLTSPLGNMLGEMGEWVREEFNQGLARYESKFTATLIWGKSTPPKTTSALNDMRKGIAFMSDDWPSMRSTIEEGVYRDILAYTKGDKEQTDRLFIDFIAIVMGNMLFWTRDQALEDFNQGLARYESKFTATLIWGKPAPSETMSEKTDV
jgi:hypothetical protein